MSDLFIVAKDKEGDYYRTINLSCTLDDSLSWKAKGLHNYIMTRPNDWQLYFQDLINRSTDGETSVRAGINELIEKDYLARLQIRDANSRIIRVCYISFRRPTELDKEDIENLYLENPNIAIPKQGNQVYSYNKDRIIRIKYKELYIDIINNIMTPDGVKKEKTKLTRKIKVKKSKNKLKPEHSYKPSELSDYSKTVQDLFNYWVDLGLIKHKKSKTRDNALQLLNIKSKHYKTSEIIKSMDNYKKLLDDPYSKLVNTYPFKVGLDEFFGFSNYYKKKEIIQSAIKSDPKLKDIKSWFEECLKDDLSHLMKQGKDEHPELTKEIKRQYLDKIDNIEITSIDENSFRKTSTLLTEFWNKHLDRFNLHPSENRNVIQFLPIFIEFMKSISNNGDHYPGLMCWSLSEKSGDKFYHWLKKMNYFRSKSSPFEIKIDHSQRANLFDCEPEY